MSSKTHLTTRRGFIATLGFGGVSLYGLWAAYGAAPGPLALLGLDGHPGEHAPDGDHGGHGDHGVATGPTAEEFNRLTSEFIERYRLPDGTVHPRVPVPEADDHGGAHGHGGGHEHTAHADPMVHGSRDGDEPLDVYLAAGKWYYRPHALRLDAGRTYRFRMMAVDVSHGASIQFGSGGRMVRLRPGRLAELELTFHRPGRHLVYCTVYCGPAHDFMQASIEVI